jgi:hypothetical protein
MRNEVIVLLFFFLGGCAGGTPQEHTVYNPAELVPYSRPGTGRIVGQAFLKNVRRDVKYSAGNTVWLHPVTSLTIDWFTRMLFMKFPSSSATHTPMTIADGPLRTPKVDLSLPVCRRASTT